MIKFFNKGVIVIIDLSFCLRVKHGSAGHCVLKPKENKSTRNKPGPRVNVSLSSLLSDSFPFLQGAPAVMSCLLVTVAGICALRPAPKITQKVGRSRLEDFPLCFFFFSFLNFTFYYY